jgi:hypothetical protein
MFQFPRFPSLAGYLSITSSGFPHSEIFGSRPACGSPKLIAAFYVLHRLLAPRHPPYALSNLTYVALVYKLRMASLVLVNNPQRNSHYASGYLLRSA